MSRWALPHILALAALVCTEGAGMAQTWQRKLPIAPSLTVRQEEPPPSLPNYVVPDFAPDKKLLPDLKTKVVTAQLGLEFIVDWTGFAQDETSIAQVGRQSDLLEVRSASGEINGEIGLGLLLSYKLGIEYNGFDVSTDKTFAITDLNVSFAIPKWRTKVSIGQMREDFSYEVVGSTASMPQSERIMTPFSAPQNTGLKVTHVLGRADRMTLSYGIFKNGFGEGDGKPAVSARFTGLVIDRPDSRQFLHLGVAVRHATVGDQAQYRSRPGVAAADDFIDTGPFPAQSTTQIGLEAHYAHGPWSIIAEHVGVHVNSDEAGNPVFRGTYILGSWVMTGESRSYDRTKGSVKRILPLGRWGAPELVARYATVNLNGGSIRGGRYERLEVGGNWWATTRWKFGLLYGHVWLDRFGQTGTTRSLLTRLQWIY